MGQPRHIAVASSFDDLPTQFNIFIIIAAKFYAFVLPLFLKEKVASYNQRISVIK